MTILALGPLTNLAAAIQHGTDLAGSTRDVIWMGGTLEERGNTTETGEWNACVDPEAAEICLRAGAIHRIFPLDATQDVVFTMEDLAVLPDTHLTGIVRDAVRFYVGFHRRPMGSTAPTCTTRSCSSVAAAPGPRDRGGHRDAGLRHQRGSVPGREPLSVRGGDGRPRSGSRSPSIPRG